MLKPISIWDPNRQSSIDNIADTIDQVTEIVLLAQVEATIDQIPKDQINQLLHLSFRNHIPLHILVSGHENNPDIIQHDIRLKNTLVIRWPLYWLTETLIRHTWPSVHGENMKLGCDFYNPKQPNSYDFTFISLNKRARYHRFLMMDALAKYDLIKNNAVTWREPYIRDDVQLLYWKQKIITLDQTDESQLFMQERFPIQYEKAFMQIVPETHEDKFFFTEKTATPIFFGKPFLVASCQNFHKQLLNFGFELYDELFDYNFDSVSNMKVRFDLLAQNIKRLDQVPKNQLPSLYEKVKEKIIHNRNHALKIACDTSKFPNIWHKLATSGTYPHLSTCPHTNLIRIKEFINR